MAKSRTSCPPRNPTLCDGRFRDALYALEQGQELAQVASWVTSLNGSSRVTWSRECYRMFDIPEDRPITFGDFLSKVHPDDRERLHAAQHRALQSGQGYDLDYRLLRPDGAIRWVNAKMTLEKDTEGRPLRMINVCQDVTEQKRTRAELRATQAQLLHAQKMEVVGRLVGGVAHDYNNALSVIQSHSLVAMEDLPPQHPIRTDLQRILSAAEFAATLTRQLLSFSRRQPAERRILDLNETASGVESMLRCIVGRDIKVNLWLPDRPMNVYADPGQMEQVLMNLVINARDAMPSGGTLTIETDEVVIETEDDPNGTSFAASGNTYVRLSVTDSGLGMDEATRLRIFEPFFTTKDPDHGTGLGLSTARDIMEDSGGYLSVSSSPGQGARFEILLPAVKALSP